MNLNWYRFCFVCASKPLLTFYLIIVIILTFSLCFKNSLKVCSLTKASPLLEQCMDLSQLWKLSKHLMCLFAAYTKLFGGKAHRMKQALVNAHRSLQTETMRWPRTTLCHLTFQSMKIWRRNLRQGWLSQTRRERSKVKESMSELFFFIYSWLFIHNTALLIQFLRLDCIMFVPWPNHYETDGCLVMDRKKTQVKNLWVNFVMLVFFCFFFNKTTFLKQLLSLVGKTFNGLIILRLMSICQQIGKCIWPRLLRLNIENPYITQYLLITLGTRDVGSRFSKDYRTRSRQT